MLTIGIAHDLVISSAAVVRDGKVVAAVAEERLNRQKQFKGFPALAIRECLRLAGTDLRDVDAIAFGWNPARQMEFPNARQSGNARFHPEYLYAIPNMLLGHFRQASEQHIEQVFGGSSPTIFYYDHQLTHAASAFYLSSFDRAAVFSADGRGERATTMWGHASREGGIHQRSEVRLPHSLGLFYGAVTQFLGYKPDSDEWKVMAMASYGQPGNQYYGPMKRLIEVDPATGRFYVDQKYLSFALPESHGGRFFTPEFVEQFGQPRDSSALIDSRHQDIAWAMQRVFEEAMTDILCAVHRQTGEDHLVAAGGCMMNSVYNGKIAQMTPFRDLFIPSCPDDSGISVGAALLAYHQLAEQPQHPRHPHNYWGPAYDDQIPEVLRSYKIDYRVLEAPSRTAAELLAGGMIVGWYQGAMEFGQRALGNRSILADPRRPDAKDLVNAAVKYREGFRPFAPAILAERTEEYFIAPHGAEVPFMERVYLFREEVRTRVPAVVHADGTGRLQTVQREHNTPFYDLIREFDRLTGVPIVLNTSFNLNGEPIVCTPTDAIRTFYSCGLDALVLGNCLVEKSGS
jgi:carbamoyltransferase